MSSRPPAVAGVFYPSDPEDLRRSIETAFAHAAPLAPESTAPKALVVPHAGYIYSGAVAASAFRRIASARTQIERVVLLGPSHRVYVRGMAVPSVDSFDTPLGTITIDAELRSVVLALPGVVIDDEPHRSEHSLEVELPFLQTVLDGFTLLPLSVGDASSEEVATLLDAAWGGPETLIVISTDLSHYHQYNEAVRLDARTATAIMAADADAISVRDACGCRPLRGMLRVAAARGLPVEQIDLRNSGDTA
ncbi:MAG: AmmeMemoRadiSam system protein B, partial [Acidimicrobiales bacterium]